MGMILAVDVSNQLYKLAYALADRSFDDLWSSWKHKISLWQSHWKPDAIVLCFDRKPDRPCFRREKFPQYKSGRSVSESLADRINEVERLTLEHAWPAQVTLLPCADGFEADDSIAFVVHHSVIHGLKVAIMSSDKDMRQLLQRDRVSIIRTVTFQRGGVQAQYITEDRMEKELGLGPRQFVDYLAMVGDSCDAVPGCPGIGEKIAVRLLSRYRSLQRIAETPNFSLPLTNRQESRLRAWIKDPEGMTLSRFLVQLYLPPMEPTWILEGGVPAHVV